MLFAVDGESVGWGFGVGAGLVALAIAAIAWARAKIAGKTTVEDRLTELTARMFTLTDSHHKCEMENRDLRGEIVTLHRHITRLEKHAGLSMGDPIQGIIIANLQGVIEEYSPALLALLGWQRDDIIGKPVTTLIPPDIILLHKPKFDAFVLDKDREADPTVIIPTEALAKNRKRVPIFIALRTWPTVNHNLITATITERQIGVTNDAIPIPDELQSLPMPK